MSKSCNIYIAVVVDDEELSRAFSRYLRAAGFHPVSYPSVESFLADTKHPVFSCLILDIHFEGMSGIELRKRLVASGSDTPVIFITGQDAPRVREEALATGDAGYFQKQDAGAPCSTPSARLTPSFPILPR